MKGLSLLFASGALAASSLPTYSSTIVSTVGCEDGSCSSSMDVVPSSFAWSNGTIPTVGKVPVSASEDPSSVETSESENERSTIYEYETVTTDDIYQVVQTVCDIYSNCYATTELEKFTTYTATVDGVLTVITTTCPYTEEAVSSDVDSTTTASDVLTTYEETITVTKTHCDEVCHTTTEEQVLTTSTTTVNGVETIYTTYCPLSTSSAPVVESTTESTTEASETPATETDISTTVVTITSCADHKCTEVPHTTGVTTVTKDNTVYTTYCPLTSETTPAKPAETSSETSETSETSSIPKPKPTTVDVITDNIITETPSPKPTTVASSAPPTSVTIPEPSVYQGSANLVQTGMLSIIISFLLALI